MTRAILCLLLATATPLLCPQGGARGSGGRAPRAVLAATFDPYPVTVGHPGRVEIVGGLVGTKGWMDSEKAQGLLRTDDRLLLYDLKMGEVGSVIVTTTGELESASPEFTYPHGYCLSYQCRVEVAPGRKRAYDEALALRKRFWAWEMPLVAIWHSSGAHEPRWVTGEVIVAGPPQEGVAAAEHGGAYRRIAVRWLRSRGFSEQQVANAVMVQVVRADLDGDKRLEVFLSFGSEQYGFNECERPRQRKYFSYLLMRRLDPASGKVRTTVLADWSAGRSIVAGFCDLDGDGRAEVIARQYGVDYIGTDLYRWSDDRLTHVGQGWWFGA